MFCGSPINTFHLVCFQGLVVSGSYFVEEWCSYVCFHTVYCNPDEIRSLKSNNG